MKSIDPLKEARAIEVDIGNKINSRRAIVEAQGRDFDKHVREVQAEQVIFADLNNNVNPGA